VSVIDQSIFTVTDEDNPAIDGRDSVAKVEHPAISKAGNDDIDGCPKSDSTERPARNDLLAEFHATSPMAGSSGHLVHLSWPRFQ